MKRSYIIIFLVIISSGCVASDSTSYIKGQETGYTKHNFTDYNICNDYYYHSIGNQTFDRDAFDLSYGYKKGYEKYIKENVTREYEKKVGRIMVSENV